MTMSDQSPISPGPSLEDRVIAAIRTVRDPEIPVNLYDLGLIYELDVSQDGAVQIRMTLTTPNCPVAEEMPQQVQRAVAAADGVSDVHVELIWEPAWTRDRMSAEAREALEMMGIDWSDHPAAGGMTSLTVGRRPNRNSA